MLALVAVLAVLPLAWLNAGGVTVGLHDPRPGQYAVENMWYVDLDNQTQNTYSCYLHGEIWEAFKGQVFRANSREFQLPPGKMTRRGRADVDPLRDEWHAAGYEQFAARTGGLPEGSYTFIVLLEPNLGGDTVQFEVGLPGPPRLISPKDGDTVRTVLPRFTWTRPVTLKPGTAARYAVRIVEVLTGQSKDEAMRASPSWFEAKDVSTVPFHYPVSARALGRGKSYAWRVTASMGGTNAGTSEVGMFVVSSAATSAAESTLTEIPFVTQSDAGTQYLKKSRPWSGDDYQDAWEIGLDDANDVWGGYWTGSWFWYDELYERGACWISKDRDTWHNDCDVHYNICRNKQCSITAQGAYEITLYADDEVYVYLDPDPLAIPDLFPDGHPADDASYKGMAGHGAPTTLDLGLLSVGRHALYFVHRNTEPEYYGFLYYVNSSERWRLEGFKGRPLSPMIGDDGTVYLPIDNMQLYALDPTADDAHRVEWCYPAPHIGSISSSPALADDPVYAGTIYVGMVRDVVALDPHAADDAHRVKWRFRTDGEWTTSSPAVGADGTVYAGSGAGTVYALDPNPSAVPRTIWSYSIPGIPGSILSSLAIGTSGAIYVGISTKGVFALDANPAAATRELWHYDCGGVVSSPAIGADGTVYVGSTDGNVYALEPNPAVSPRVKWSHATGDSVLSSPAIGADGTVYIGSNDGFVYALDPDPAAASRVKWSFSVGPRTGARVTSSPAIAADGTVYVAVTDGSVYALDPDASAANRVKRHYTVGWNWSSSEDQVDPSPALGTDGTLYVPTGPYGGGICAVRCPFGRLATTPWPKWGQNSRNTRRAP